MHQAFCRDLRVCPEIRPPYRSSKARRQAPKREIGNGLLCSKIKASRTRSDRSMSSRLSFSKPEESLETGNKQRSSFVGCWISAAMRSRKGSRSKSTRGSSTNVPANIPDGICISGEPQTALSINMQTQSCICTDTRATLNMLMVRAA
eukprot:848341-Alexandrium_andersonii.AAC.1